MLQAGAILGGTYRLERFLGKGGMGEVWLATHLLLNEPRAIKLLRNASSADPISRDRFINREARIMLRLEAHPNIVRVFELGLHEDAPYIVMEYIEEGPLGNNLQQLLQTRGKLRLEEAGAILEQVAAALEVAHRQGVVHRDIKPSNVLLAKSKDQLPVAKLGDFGLTKDLEGEQDLTSANFAVGTPAYMSPEQAEGEAEKSSDLYSLGVVLYEMVTGRPPFLGSASSILVQHITKAPPPPQEFEPSIPPEVAAVILRALAKKPPERYQSALEFAIAFNRAVREYADRQDSMATAVLPVAGDTQRASPGFQNAPKGATLRADFALEAKAQTVPGNKLPPHNLPVQLTSFIGREADLVQIKLLLQHAPLLTLTGSGGTGKTRLSLQAAQDLLPNFADGVWLVELAALSDPALLAQETANVLGVREEPGRPLMSTLISHLQDRQILLVLDNCEHLITACAQLAESLLRSCPNLRILATSREGLAIGGETTWRVPSLALPPLSAWSSSGQAPDVERLTQYEAVRLFIDRAAAVQPGFAVTNQNAAAVAQLCQHLDGIPLAIELAAARMKVFTVEQLATRVGDRFRILTGGSRTALPRHQTLRALIGWSYDLLSEAEKILLRRLAVFAGGWSLEAAEAICTGEGIEDWEALDLLAQLVNKSLALMEQPEEGQSGEARYRLLETIRQYGQEKLDEAREHEIVKERHLSYFLKLAEEAAPKLEGAEQAYWLGRLDAEHDNLRLALQWARQKQDGSEGRLCGALWQFWQIHGEFSEGRRWLEEALDALAFEGILLESPAPKAEKAYPVKKISNLTDKDSPAVRAKMVIRAGVLLGAGTLAWAQDEYDRAELLLEEALAFYSELGDKHGSAVTLMALGRLALSMGNADWDNEAFEQALRLWRQLGDKVGTAVCLASLGFIVRFQGDQARATNYMREAVSLWSILGDKSTVVTSFVILASIAQSQADYARCMPLIELILTLLKPAGRRDGLEEALALSRKLHSTWGIVTALYLLGTVALAEQDYSQAENYLRESLALNRELGDRWAVACSLGFLGKVALSQENYERARPLIEESLSLYRELDNKWGCASTLNSLGWLEQRQGNFAEAEKYYRESMQICETLQDREGLAEGLQGLAALAETQGDEEHAARLKGAAQVLQEEKSW